MKNIHDELRMIFASVFEEDDIQLTDQTSAKDIPLWDSLHHVLLISELEEKFNIEFDLEELTSFNNVGDIKASIQAKLNETS
jgi:acyl carrier protein